MAFVGFSSELTVAGGRGVEGGGIGVGGGSGGGGRN